ncbi:MAG: translation initiation factor IF-2 [Prevotella sp.]|jgi:translation initiation factor IF-2|nr:translation initiation factor IF-2 [Prevotella sp.]
MGVRLNKVLSELNIGLQTAVDFLKKKSALGEIKDDATPNTKISDEQYDALVNEFSTDKAVKTKAEMLFAKKPKEKKVAEKPEKKAVVAADELLESHPQFKPVGKIDLDTIGKAKAASKPEQSDASIDSAEHEQAAPKAEPEPVDAAEPQEEVKAEPAVAEPEVERITGDGSDDPISKGNGITQNRPHDPDSEEEAVVEEDDDEEEEEDVEEETAAPAPVKTPGELKAAQNMPQLNVLGKIDLSSLNQSTRPKKKTKEERRKEREEKAAGERKKRERIRQGRVDIEAAAKQANQQQQQQNKKNQNKNGNQQQQQGGKKNKKNRPVKPLEVDDEAVARQVKETLARLTSKTNQNKKGAKYRKEKRDAVAERMNEEMAAEAAESKVLKLTEFVTVSELATMMNVGVNQVIGTCMSIGIMVSINQRLDAETINIVADEFGFTTEYVSAEVQNAITEEEDDENDLISRAPIVTVMGHVDHGKTSLLDHIRNTNVIAGEAGGITQHIGAYNVKLKDGHSITFLDTPGHEAFTAMRARGAQVTDIAIIIVAADDSVMPTTKEAIAHAQAANVPMVFAINKIDKPGANPDKIREDLANMNLLVEDWGGKYQCQEISAKKGQGVYELLEKVLLEAEMLDLKANPNRKATGSIIESSLDKGRGYVSTVLVSNGTLKIGDVVIAGTAWGRVKAMFNERNQRIEKAGPAEPAIILGLNGAPTAGDSFHVMETEQEAREIANKRIQLQREQSLRTTTKLGLDELSHRIALGEFHELNIIVKGDTDGSIEALSDSFIKLSTEKVQVNVISKAVGQISENDVMLASASQAIIIGFQVRPSADARRAADREGVEINTYSIIYDAIDDVKSTMEGMLDKVKKEIVTGEIEVKQVFKISKVGTVAGGLVTDGKVHNKDKARVVRDGIVVHTAPIDALKRYKDDAKEVATGLECGISLVNFNDIQVGDIIETFTEIEVEQKL